MTEAEFKKIIKPGDLLIIRTMPDGKIYRILFIVSMEKDFSNVWLYSFRNKNQVTLERSAKIHHEKGRIDYFCHFLTLDFDVVKP